MPRVDVISFDEALARSTAGKRHLLLGNGFSIALMPDIFTYGALYDNADFSGIPHAHAVFDALATRDFEQVIRLLKDMSLVLKEYEEVPKEVVQQIGRDAEAIKTILANAIASRHPDVPNDVSPDLWAHCRAFLANFRGGKIYTMNYDALLYWALMNDDVDDVEIKCDDGFRTPEDDPDQPYVTWQQAQAQSVYYLHGALHLFDAGHELQKYTWKRTEIPILDQIRAAMDEDRYPLFVSEGDSETKLNKIMHSAYLHKGLRSLENIGGSLFIFGHSLATNDDHVLHMVERNKVRKLFVGLHGDPQGAANQLIVGRSNQISDARAHIFKGKRPLLVEFFESDTANVWG